MANQSENYGERISTLEGALPPTRDRLNDLHDDVKGLRSKLDETEKTLRSKLDETEKTLRSELSMLRNDLVAADKEIADKLEKIDTRVSNRMTLIIGSIGTSFVTIMISLLFFGFRILQAI